MKTAKIILVCLILADAVTTFIGLRLGAKEWNPLLNWVFKRIGVYLGLFLKTVMGIAIVLFAQNVWLTLLVVILWALVCWSNMRKIRCRMK